MLFLLVLFAAVCIILGGIIQKVVHENFINPVKRNSYVLAQNWDHEERPRGREYSWTIKHHQVCPDGICKMMTLVNNEFPGPLIEANEGDWVHVRVKNEATNATSIHWHGIYQTGTPFMDGTVGVTQCPIASGESFTYSFWANQSGTYWWHAHQGVQSSDGIHGPLIIHARNEKELRPSYSSDRVLLLSDHYWNDSSQLLWDSLKPDKGNVEPIPNGGLINGCAKHRNCSDIPEGWTCQEKAKENKNSLKKWFARMMSGPQNDLTGYPWLALERNKSHRLRLINVGAFAKFQFQVDEHELAVTEVDGTDVHPHKVRRVAINPAQRYSVIINATVPRSDRFWMRARMDPQCFARKVKSTTTDVLGVVYYNATSSDNNSLINNSTKGDVLPMLPNLPNTHPNFGADPTSTDWPDALDRNCKDLNTTDLVPVDVQSASSDDIVFFHVRSSFRTGATRLAIGRFNETTYSPDLTSPTLLRAWDGLKLHNASFDQPKDELVFVNHEAFDVSRELVIQSNQSQMIDILINNFDDGTHPIHLHGYKFWVLAQGNDSYPPRRNILVDDYTRENLQPLYDTLDFTNPLRRDTASVEPFGWVLLRVYADNPGVWALHCHGSWHSEAGMLVQLLTNTDGLDKLEPPKGMRELCQAHGVTTGAGPRDEEYRALAMGDG